MCRKTEEHLCGVLSVGRGSSGVSLGCWDASAQLGGAEKPRLATLLPVGMQMVIFVCSGSSVLVMG